jgi:hypothetical protein
MPIMSQLGAKAAQQTSATAKCSAKPTTAPKEISKFQKESFI